MFNLIFGATTTLFAVFAPVAHADELPIVTPPPIVQQYCSCVAYVRNFIPETPRLDAEWFQTLPRTYPAVGRVVIFKYKDGVSHVAYISEVEEGGFWVKEANYKRCQKGVRFIDWKDPNIVGFWSPNP